MIDLNSCVTNTNANTNTNVTWHDPTRGTPATAQPIQRPARTCFTRRSSSSIVVGTRASVSIRMGTAAHAEMTRAHSAMSARTSVGTTCIVILPARSCGATRASSCINVRNMQHHLRIACSPIQIQIQIQNILANIRDRNSTAHTAPQLAIQPTDGSGGKARHGPKRAANHPSARLAQVEHVIQDG
jgi:hypothetical protein